MLQENNLWFYLIFMSYNLSHIGHYFQTQKMKVVLKLYVIKLKSEINITSPIIRLISIFPVVHLDQNFLSLLFKDFEHFNIKYFLVF